MRTIVLVILSTALLFGCNIIPDDASEAFPDKSRLAALHFNFHGIKSATAKADYDGGITLNWTSISGNAFIHGNPTRTEISENSSGLIESIEHYMDQALASSVNISYQNGDFSQIVLNWDNELVITDTFFYDQIGALDSVARRFDLQQGGTTTYGYVKFIGLGTIDGVTPGTLSHIKVEPYDSNFPDHRYVESEFWNNTNNPNAESTKMYKIVGFTSNSFGRVDVGGSFNTYPIQVTFPVRITEPVTRGISVFYDHSTDFDGNENQEIRERFINPFFLLPDEYIHGQNQSNILYMLYNEFYEGGGINNPDFNSPFPVVTYEYELEFYASN